MFLESPEAYAAQTLEVKAARLAGASGMTCELHTALYHPLELANLQTARAMSNTSWFELLYPLEDCAFELEAPLDIRDGYAYPPQAPGLGAVYDWDAIDDATVGTI